ncbi:MAG: hypothetical protein WC505_04420 [Patescibacteria group bacterium]
MTKKSNKVVRSATEALKLLWKIGFLKQWRTYPGIVERLDSNDYHFTTPELGMALKRAKYLTRRGARGSYEYIQKHPYVEEE